MPQMAPMNWMMLFLFFFLIFILFNILNFYIHTPTNNEKKSNYSFKNNLLNWKW